MLRRTSEVEEQTNGRGISTLFQGDATPSERLGTVCWHIVALLDEEIRVASIRQLHGDLRTILIHLDLKLEVIGLRSAGGQLCVNVELSLPLVLAKVGRQCNLVSITFEASLSEVDAVPSERSSSAVTEKRGINTQCA